MNYHICKKCNKCLFKRIKKRVDISNNENCYLIVKQPSSEGWSIFNMVQTEIPIEIKNKTLKQLEYDSITKEFYFYKRVDGEQIIYWDDLLREIKMKKNEFCPYYMEHYFDDMEHQKRKKDWKKKQKNLHLNK